MLAAIGGAHFELRASTVPRVPCVFCLKTEKYPSQDDTVCAARLWHGHVKGDNIATRVVSVIGGFLANVTPSALLLSAFWG